jgi:hypothetical protein
MSVKKIQPGPGIPDIVVRKGKPLTSNSCPACQGNLIDATNARGQRIQKCGRCKAEVTSKPF